MTRQETVLSVFVASPSDVNAEREVLEEVIRSFNINWSKTFSIRLELISWETHVAPDFGTSAQDVINRQIGDDFDIFIGIMWTKYGTPTEKAGSGTEEEFNRAYNLYKEGSKKIRIMFYFKDEQINPSSLDIEQYSKVSYFRKSLPDKGGLYWTFTDTENFRNFVSLHLNQVVKDWKNSHKLEDKSKDVSLTYKKDYNESDKIVEFSQSQEEAGFIDLIEQSKDSFDFLAEIVERMTSYLSELTKKIEVRTDEFNEIINLPDEIKLKKAKRVSKNTAEDMTQFVNHINVEMPAFSKNLRNGLDSYGNAASLIGDFEISEPKELEGALETIINLKNTFTSTKKSVNSFLESVEILPRVTTALNRAKYKTTEVLKNFLKELKEGESLTIEIEKSIRNIMP